MQEIMEMGSKLSLTISCPVHYPAYGKNIFECRCNKLFPIYVVKGKSNDEMKALHNELKSTSLP